MAKLLATCGLNGRAGKAGYAGIRWGAGKAFKRGKEQKIFFALGRQGILPLSLAREKTRVWVGWFVLSFCFTKGKVCFQGSSGASSLVFCFFTKLGSIWSEKGVYLYKRSVSQEAKDPHPILSKMVPLRGIQGLCSSNAIYRYIFTLTEIILLWRRYFSLPFICRKIP